MRRSLLAAAIAALSLLLAGTALAAFTQVSNITLTGKKAFEPTGISADVHSMDPSAHQPKAAKQLVVTFPSKTKFNLSSIKACTLNDVQLKAGTQCPSKSLIGTGTAAVNAWPLLTKVPASVNAYVASKTKMVMVATASVFGTKLRTVIRSTVSGNKLTIPIPTENLSGIKAVVTALKLKVSAKVGGKTLVTAGKCTSGKFVVKSHFTYVDGSTFDTSSSSPCTS